VSTDVSPPRTFAARLWRYQAERFPLANHGVLTLVFAAAVCSFAAAFVGRTPALLAIALAAIAGLCQFALLRIADEHKDFETDKAHRPYRAVPRGLVSLGELRMVGAVAAAVMLAAVAAAQSTGLALLTIVLWVYFALMTAEFFVGDWLKRRPVVYLLSHMVITPLLALVMAGFQLAHDGMALTALPVLVPALPLAILLLGVVMELGRKIRATSDEEPGVETYSALWGAARARTYCLITALAAAAAAVAAVSQIQGSVTAATLAAGAGVAILGVAAARFTPSQPGAGKRIEQASGAFALAVLLALGSAPHIGALP
jgi:4-hydroxybenzoate polyprenyltransferase